MAIERKQKYLSCFCLMKYIDNLEKSNAHHLIHDARSRIERLYKDEYLSICAAMEQGKLNINQLTEMWLIDSVNQGNLC